MGSYVSTTIKEEKEMLDAIGVNSIDDLFKNVPEEVKIKGELNLPDGLSEMEVKNLMESMANKNKVFSTSIAQREAAEKTFFNINEVLYSFIFL